MKKSKIFPVWIAIAILLAAGFATWGMSLLISVNRLQKDVQQYARRVSGFSKLEKSVRSLESAMLERPLHLLADSALSYWQQQYSDYEESKNALLNDSSDAGEIRQRVNRIDASVEKLKSIYTLKLLPSPENWIINREEIEFRREMNAAISLVNEAEVGFQNHIGNISGALAEKWRSLNILVFVSCLLAITLSLVLYIQQKDSTRRKRTEKALYRITAEFRAIFKSIPDAVIFTDIHNEIIMVNPAFTVLFGYQPEEVMGQQAGIFFSNHNDFKPRNGNPAGAVSQKRLKPYEITCRRKNGEEFISETVATPVNDDREQPFGIFSIIRDVTKRKAAEKALSEARSKLEIRVNERTEELLRANEEIKRFAYIVSHDLRAPLVNIKGFAAELREAFALLNLKIGGLLNGLPGESREEISDIILEEIPEALHFIDSSATRMGALIDAVLKLSRLGRRELHFERINARVIIQKILDSLAHQIEQKGVNLQIGALPRVIADKTSLEQIFGNILVNAVNYLDPARPGEIEISGESHSSETIYHIRDNGQGIAEDHLEKIFEPFSRFGNRDVPGEGMGLAYVQKLVRRHGGRIWCQSQPGVGTTISFSLSNKPVQEMELA